MVASGCERMSLVNHSHESKTYSVHAVASRLRVSYNAARKLCLETDQFPVMRLGKRVLIHKTGFDKWLNSESVYTVSEVADMLGVNKRSVYNFCLDDTIQSIRIGSCVRIPSKDLDKWLDGDSNEKENDYVNHQQ